MARKLPPLNALRFFEIAARHRSFARAAEELHVTPAAVSQQIKLLENYLGMALFKRGKILELNETAGEALSHISQAFDQMERAMLKITAGSIAGPLIVSTPPAFATHWLIPRMADFYARYPEVEIHVLATRRTVDFSMEEVDVAIRFGHGEHPGLNVERLMPERIMAVATPELAASIVAPDDLSGASLIQDDWHTVRGVFPMWDALLARLGVVDKPLKIRRFGDAQLTIHAAMAGLGVALAWQSLVLNDLEAGRLGGVLQLTVPTNLSYHLVIPDNRIMLDKVAIFRTWLFEQVTG